MSELATSAITLNYVCRKDGTTVTQPLPEVTFVGTAICPECADDMDLTDTVTVKDVPEADMRRCLEADEHFPSQRHARAVCLAPSVVFERLHEEARAYARQMGNAGISDILEAITDAYIAGDIGADPS